MFEHFLSVGFSPAVVMPDSGPGPQGFKKYDAVNDVGYYGNIPLSDLFTIEAIEAMAVTPLPGAPNNRTSANRWIKANFKGKVIYMPYNTVRTGTTWADIYRAGFMYGVDGPGRVPPASGPVNQLRTITKTSGNGTVYTFMIRAVRSYATDPYPVSLVTADILSSEFSQTRERFNDPSQGGPANFYWEILGNGLGGQTLGPESSIAGTNALMLNNNSSYLRRDSWDKTTTSFCNFYPVLELVSVV